MTKQKNIIVKPKNFSSEVYKRLKKLTLMDNIFMNLFLNENIPCVEEILRVILGKKDLLVKSVHTQKMLQGFSRSVCLDVFAEDSKGILYNIEIQQSDEGADARRARFHMGMIDVHALKAGQSFKELPECYVIFITRHDVLKLKQTIYTIHRYIDGKMKPFEDGSHIIYVNCSAKDDGTEIWKLIHDLQCPNADEMFFPRLAKKMRSLKDPETEEGVEAMDELSIYLNELAQEAAKHEAERTEKRVKENTALELIKLGKLTIAEIAQSLGLSVYKVRQLAKTL